MSSSVMAMDYSDSNKKDVAFSVFELISQQETRSATSGVHRPSIRHSGKRRRTQQKLDSCPGQHSSKIPNTMSVLVEVKPVQDQMRILGAELKRSKRRDKRERRVPSGEHMKPTVSKSTDRALLNGWCNCAQESSGDVMKRGKQTVKHSIPILSAKHEETKADAESCREGKKIPNLAAPEIVQCDQGAIESDNGFLEHQIHPSITRNVPPQEGQLSYGTGSRVLSFEVLDVSAYENLLGISTGPGTGIQVSSPAIDESMVEEAAITLLRLSSSKSENEKENSEIPLNLPVIEIKKNPAYIGGRKMKRMHAMRETRISSHGVVGFKRRSGRSAVPTQRYAPDDTRRRNRSTGSKEVTSLKRGASTGAMGGNNRPKANSGTAVTAAKEEEQGEAVKSVCSRRSGSRLTTLSSINGDNTDLVETKEGSKSILRQLKTRDASANGTESNMNKSVASACNENGSRVEDEESKTTLNEADEYDTMKGNKMRKSEATEDSPCQRKSSRRCSQAANSTPPHKTNVEDDFFDSMQKLAKVESTSEDEESFAKQSSVKKRGHKKKAKGTISNHRKLQAGTDENTSHSESNMPQDDAHEDNIMKRKKKWKSDSAADSPSQRRSSSFCRQSAEFTSPHKGTVEDDIFGSMQKPSRTKSASEGEESVAQRGAVSRTEHGTKAGLIDSHGLKGKHATFGDTSYSETMSNTIKGISKKPLLRKQAVVQRRRNTGEPALVDLDGWTLLQVASLRSAYAKADPCSDQFWEQVANQIDGQGENECRKKWFSLVNTPARKKTRTGQAKRGNAPAMIQVEVDEDDLFNSTPMRVRLLEDDDEEKNHHVFDIDFGSPIVVDESYKWNQVAECDDERKADVATAKVGYSKTFIKNLKRDISKGGKEKARKKIRHTRDAGSRGISSAVDCGDLEVKGTLSPGGTMQVRTVYWNGESEDEDDIFDSDEE